MLGFLAGFLMVCGALIGWNACERLFITAELIWLLAVIPSLSAGLTAVLLQYRSPRQILDRRSARWPAQLISGLVSGTISMMFALCGIIFADHLLSDSLIMAISACAVTGLVILFSARIKTGLCIRCHYDIRASLQFGRCPECGLAF